MLPPIFGMFVLISAGAKFFVYLPSVFFFLQILNLLSEIFREIRSRATFLLLLAANSVISDSDCAALAFNQIQSNKNLPNVSN